MLVVNGGDAHAIMQYGNQGNMGNPDTSGWPAGAIVPLTYDGNVWYKAFGYNSNTTYTNALLGQGYCTCSTAEGTLNKTAGIVGYTLLLGGIVVVNFVNAVPANATLNINSQGAKAIYHRGAAIASNVIEAGDTAYFVYDGTYYQLLGIDRWEDTQYTAGIGIEISENNVIRSKGVLAVGTGGENGTIAVTVGNNTSNVSVKGLGNLAYQNSIPTATTTTLGLVKIGSGINISNGTISVAPIEGNVTGDGTAGHLTKFTSDNIIGNGPELSAAITTQSQLTKFLREDGTWATPSYTENTDETVKQTNSSGNANYRVLFSSSADDTTKTEGARKSTGLQFNPSTQTLTVANLSGKASSATTAEYAGTAAHALTALNATLASSANFTQYASSAGFTVNAASATWAKTAEKTQGTLTIGGKSFNGSTAVTVTAQDLDIIGALHYLGITSDVLTDGSTLTPITIGTETKTPQAGDVTLSSQGHQEFIWNGTSWELLGDEANYKILQHVVTAPTATNGYAFSFVDTLSQNINGEITYTTKTIPNASSTTAGLITTGTQTIAGAKTFTNVLTASTFVGALSGVAASAISADSATYAVSAGLATSAVWSGSAGYAETANYAYNAKTATRAVEAGKVNGHTVESNVPANAVFTDTWKANGVGVEGYVAATTAGTVNKVWKTDANGVPGWRTDEDQKYPEASSTTAGLLSVTLYSKLVGIATAARVGTIIQIQAGSGLTGGTITTSGTIAHGVPTGATSSTLGTTGTARTYIKSITTDEFGHVVGIGTGTENVTNTDRYVNTATFADVSSTTAGAPIKMTLKRAGSDSTEISANIPVVSTTSAGVAPKGNVITTQSQTTKFLREDGTWAAPSYTTNSNTTYTFTNGTNGSFKVKPSGGSEQTVTIGKPATAGAADTAAEFASAQSVTLTGDVTGTASSKAGWSVATTLASTGVTTGSYGMSATTAPGYGGTFVIPYITVDEKGRITSATNSTVTLPAVSHYTTHLYAGTGSAANATATNGNVKLSVADNTTVRNNVVLKGSDATTVTSDGSGNVTVTSHDTQTTVAWDATNKKITKTIDGTTTDVVTVSDIQNKLDYTSLKTSMSLNNVNNTSDANKPISTATQAALDDKAPLDSPALRGTPTAPTAAAGTNTTQIATTAFVTSAISALVGPMKFIGTLGTGGTTASLAAATTANRGYTYKVITASTYQGVAAKVGDMLVSDGSAWILIPSGDEPGGTVLNVATGDGLTGGPITTSGTLSHAVPSGATSGTHGGLVDKTYVKNIETDKFGHIVSVNTGTESEYVLLMASADTLGGIKVGSGLSITNSGVLNHSNSVAAKTSYGSTSATASADGGKITVTDIKYDNQGHITSSTDRTITLSQVKYTLGGLGGVGSVTATGTTPLTLTATSTSATTGTSVVITGSVAAASTTSAGLMSKEDKIKLDGIASGANNYTYTLPTASSTTKGGAKIGTTLSMSNETLNLAALSTSATTSTASPTHGTTFTAVDSVVTDGYGRVTKVNTKTITLPPDNNTDINVRQQLYSSNYNLPLLMSYQTNTNTTTNVDNISFRNNNIYANPSTGLVAATTMKIAEKVSLVFNSTTNALDFVFA